MTGITINGAETPDDIAAIRDLCWAYRDFLLTNSPTDREITETFYPIDKYRAIMDDLTVTCGPPKGAMLLARDGAGTAIGCGMIQPLFPDTAEIKRVFVTDAARGKGVARDLCTALIAHAKARGFARIVLDTSRTLTAAQSLYLRLGFTPRGPYQPIPEDVLPDLKFYEMTL